MGYAESREAGRVFFKGRQKRGCGGLGASRAQWYNHKDIVIAFDVRVGVVRCELTSIASGYGE
jgi:hypothetical protein